MHSIEEAIANLRAAHRRRGSAKFIERTLIVLILGVGMITGIQYVHITGATEYFRVNSARANATSPTQSLEFAEGKIVKR
jgi:hypothetical protein